MNWIVVLAGLSGAMAVGAGAFGAHGAQPQAAEWLRTGGMYQLVHAVAAVAAVQFGARGPAWLFLAGGLVFAGTLYAMAFGAPRWLGAVTPVGGTLLIAGWLWLGGCGALHPERPFRMESRSTSCQKEYAMAPETILIPTYVQMLKALSAWLGKAQAQLPEGAEALLSARLAPDMFPLATQVRFACVQAQEGVFRLKGDVFPASIDVLLEEGRDAGEHPGSIADAQARIDETIAMVESAASEAFDADPQRPIVHSIPAGIVFDLTAERYARDWAMPQFYFHLMIAYAILRRGGIDLGKVDYVAHMFAYARPGTIPLQ